MYVKNLKYKNWLVPSSVVWQFEIRKYDHKRLNIKNVFMLPARGKKHCLKNQNKSKVWRKDLNI